MNEGLVKECIASLEGYQVKSYLDRKLLLGVLDKKEKKLKCDNNLNDLSYNPEPEHSEEFSMPVEAKTRINKKRIDDILEDGHSRNSNFDAPYQLSIKGK